MIPMYYLLRYKGPIYAGTDEIGTDESREAISAAMKLGGQNLKASIASGHDLKHALCGVKFSDPLKDEVCLHLYNPALLLDEDSFVLMTDELTTKAMVAGENIAIYACHSETCAEATPTAEIK